MGMMFLAFFRRLLSVTQKLFRAGRLGRMRVFANKYTNGRKIPENTRLRSGTGRTGASGRRYGVGQAVAGRFAGRLQARCRVVAALPWTLGRRAATSAGSGRRNAESFSNYG